MKKKNQYSKRILKEISTDENNEKEIIESIIGKKPIKINNNKQY